MRIFWSYARRDDLGPKNKVSDLRQAFSTVVSQVLGNDCEIFFDKGSLKWGVIWRDEIKRQIKESDFFVATVTPSFLKSRMCMFELHMAYTEGKTILPIYFRTCKEFKSSFTESGVESDINKNLNETFQKISDIQMKDFRELRNLKFDSRKVADFLDGMADEIT